MFIRWSICLIYFRIQTTYIILMVNPFKFSFLRILYSSTIYHFLHSPPQLPLCLPIPLKLMASFSLLSLYVHDMHTYNLLSPFHVAFMYMVLELNMGLDNKLGSSSPKTDPSSLSRCQLPVALHLGVRFWEISSIYVDKLPGVIALFRQLYY